MPPRQVGVFHELSAAGHVPGEEEYKPTSEIEISHKVFVNHLPPIIFLQF